MKTDSIFGDSERDLAPIFSSSMVSITMGCLWVLGIILVLTWPFRSLFHYIEGFRIPQTFLATFVGGLIMVSYLNLRCALGEIIPDSIFARLEREDVTTFEEERDYLSYGFPHFRASHPGIPPSDAPLPDPGSGCHRNFPASLCSGPGHSLYGFPVMPAGFLFPASDLGKMASVRISGGAGLLYSFSIRHRFYRALSKSGPVIG